MLHQWAQVQILEIFPSKEDETSGRVIAKRVIEDFNVSKRPIRKRRPEVDDVEGNSPDMDEELERESPQRRTPENSSNSETETDEDPDQPYSERSDPPLRKRRRLRVSII